MSKKSKETSIEQELPTKVMVEGEELELKTDKKLLKRVVKLVRKLDNIITDLNDVSNDTYALVEVNTVDTPVTERDASRFNEIKEVVISTTAILYQLTNRMSRKYVGKEVKPLGTEKRKALKG